MFIDIYCLKSEFITYNLCKETEWSEIFDSYWFKYLVIFIACIRTLFYSNFCTHELDQICSGLDQNFYECNSTWLKELKLDRRCPGVLVSPQQNPRNPRCLITGPLSISLSPPEDHDSSWEVPSEVHLHLSVCPLRCLYGIQTNMSNLQPPQWLQPAPLFVPLLSVLRLLESLRSPSGLQGVRIWFCPDRTPQGPL